MLLVEVGSVLSFFSGDF